MTRSLMTGVSGLRTHQQQLDVVANNLANMNTIGFKSQSTTFADLMYNTNRAGSGSVAGSTGGTNPHQIGTGVKMGQINRNFSQGRLESTGELLDFAIQGDGFFSLNGPNGEQVYSRAGSFGLDESGNLVDPATGYLVQRSGNLGEPTATQFGFQTPGDSSIQVPLGSSIAGEPTAEIEFFGNLPSNSTPPLAEVLSSVEPFATSAGAATGATLFNDLTINDVDYGAGDQIEISGTNPDGTPFSSSFAAATATLQDLVDELNSQLVDATAALQPNGTLTVTADNTGEAFSSLVIQDAAGNTGATSFTENAMIVTTEGKEADRFETFMEVYDSRGNDHVVQFAFDKQSIDGWSITATLTDGSGTFIDDQVLDLFFNEDGTFEFAGGTGTGDTDIEIDFNTITAPQTINLNLNNLSHMATEFGLSQAQDGSPPGTLVTVAVSSSGQLDGLATNGRSIPLAQLAIARFSNNGGLVGEGNNYFSESAASGAASIGLGASGGRGLVIGNQIENSNVDIAQEFTQLIVAQRGFSANARTITVADEVLEELTNIIR